MRKVDRTLQSYLTTELCETNLREGTQCKPDSGRRQIPERLQECEQCRGASAHKRESNLVPPTEAHQWSS